MCVIIKYSYFTIPTLLSVAKFSLILLLSLVERRHGLLSVQVGIELHLLYLFEALYFLSRWAIRGFPWSSPSLYISYGIPNLINDVDLANSKFLVGFSLFDHCLKPSTFLVVDYSKIKIWANPSSIHYGPW